MMNSEIAAHLSGARNDSGAGGAGSDRKNVVLAMTEEGAVVAVTPAFVIARLMESTEAISAVGQRLPRTFQVLAMTVEEAVLVMTERRRWSQ
jgi:hypothetical protein